MRTQELDRPDVLCQHHRQLNSLFDPVALMSVDLTSLPGVVIHQHANVDEAVLQAVGVDCWERRNHFSIKLLPPDNVSIVETKSDPNMWYVLCCIESCSWCDNIETRYYSDA